MSSIIKPFCGTRYNPSKIEDMSLVVCPPYDVIDHKQLVALRKKSPYNFSHILLADNNNYKELGKKFRTWLKQGVLIEDDDECIYLYEQKFKCDGKGYSRFGFLSLLRMDKKDAVFPHEHTLAKPKEDREKMINETKTNLSPIFVIVPQTIDIFNKTYQSYRKKTPIFKFKDINNNDNSIWKISDKSVIAKICDVLEKCSLVIADGHHRFEVSYEYYKKNTNKFKDLNYVLAYVAAAQKGLLILPTHRVVTIKDARDKLLDSCAEYFTIREVSGNSLKNKLKQKGIFSFGIYNNGKYYFLKSKDIKILNNISGDEAYKKLDSYLLHQFVFSLCEVDGPVEYTHNINEAKRMAGKDKTAFLLRPALLEDVFAIANKGYRLPQKSTYFYPKLVSGAVIRRFTK